jgi:cobalamin biosynthesis Co2+ chelatase CbiK
LGEDFMNDKDDVKILEEKVNRMLLDADEVQTILSKHGVDASKKANYIIVTLAFIYKGFPDVFNYIVETAKEFANVVLKNEEGGRDV